MRKIVVGLIVLLVAGVVLLLPPQGNGRTERVVAESPVPSPSPVSVPMTLEIPALGIHSDVEEVGMDSEGRMAVPSGYSNVGWWKLGAKPGDKGSAVMAGHYDSPTGSPGVFYNLADVQVGTSLFVKDHNGRRYEYQVYKVTEHSDAAFPLQTVFAQNDGFYLNLITCSGTWDSTLGNYSDRTVVYARMLY